MKLIHFLAAGVKPRRSRRGPIMYNCSFKLKMSCIFFKFACLQQLFCAGELYFNSYTRKHKISTLYSVLYARKHDVLVSLLYFRQSYVIVLFACLMLILSETYGKTLHECLVMLVRSGLIVLAYYLLIC